MEKEQKMKIEIQKDIGDLSRTINLLCNKYKDEPILDEVQKAFLSLSVHVGRALDIQLQ